MSNGRDPRIWKSTGMTLVEVVAVLCIISFLYLGILSTHESTSDRAAIDRARAELALLAEGIEMFQAIHGDYPWIHSGSDGARELYSALIGMTFPKGDSIPGEDRGYAAYIDLAQFVIASPAGVDESPVLRFDHDGQVLVHDPDFRQHFFVDPWGRPYRYAYKRIGSDGITWRVPHFILISEGAVPNEVSIPVDGLLTRHYREGIGCSDDIIWGE